MMMVARKEILRHSSVTTRTIHASCVLKVCSRCFKLILFLHLRSTLDSVLERNCLSTLSPTDRTKCTTAEDKSCVVCISRGCNSQRWPTCHVCEETTNSTCPVEQFISGSFCKNHKEQAECFEQFVQGNVQRGCVSDLIPAVDPCLSNGKCKSCIGNDCNKERSDRFQNVACLQCTADGMDSDGSCLLGVQVSQSCEDRSNGGCFTWINDGTYQAYLVNPRKIMHLFQLVSSYEDVKVTSVTLPDVTEQVVEAATKKAAMLTFFLRIGWSVTNVRGRIAARNRHLIRPPLFVESTTQITSVILESLKKKFVCII